MAMPVALAVRVRNMTLALLDRPLQPYRWVGLQPDSTALRGEPRGPEAVGRHEAASGRKS